MEQLDYFLLGVDAVFEFLEKLSPEGKKSITTVIELREKVFDDKYFVEKYYFSDEFNREKSFSAEDKIIPNRKRSKRLEEDLLAYHFNRIGLKLRKY